MANLNVELSDTALNTLHSMAALRQVPVESVLEELLSPPYFELSDQQMAEVDLAIAAIERNEIATNTEVKTFFATYGE